MFKTGTLDQLADITMGQSPKGLSVSKNNGVPLINGPTEFGIYHPIPFQFTSDPKRMARKGDLLFCVRGSTGKMNWADQDYAIGRGIAAIRQKNLNTIYFIKGVLEYNLNKLINSAIGSVITGIKKDDLFKLEVPIPDTNKIVEINEILKNFSKKIENNHKINKILKEICSSLFKSWFLKFEPLRKKINSKYNNDVNKFSNFFPNSIKDSTLGKIPKGWEASSLQKIITRLKDKVGEMDVKVLTAVSDGELIPSEDYFSKKVYSKELKNYLKVEKYDFAYNPSRINIGSIGMNKHDYTGCVSPIYIVFKTKKNWHYFVDEFLKLQSTNSRIKQLASGSVRQSLSFEDFASISLILPEINIIEEYNKIYISLNQKIIQNNKEIKILKDIISKLSQKLILGEKILISEKIIK